MQHVGSEEFIIELPASYHQCSYVITPSDPQCTTEVTIDDHFNSLTWFDYQRLCGRVMIIYPTGKMFSQQIILIDYHINTFVRLELTTY